MITLKKSPFQDISKNMNKILSSLLFLFLINFPLQGEECAIMLGDEIDPEEFSESTGKKIYFCCGSCVKAFDGAAAYYIKAVPALAKKYTDAEKKKLGVDKVKLLDQRVCPFIQSVSSTQIQKPLNTRVRLSISGHQVHNVVGNAIRMPTSRKLSIKDIFPSLKVKYFHVFLKTSLVKMGEVFLWKLTFFEKHIEASRGTTNLN